MKEMSGTEVGGRKKVVDGTEEEKGRGNKQTDATLVLKFCTSRWTRRMDGQGQGFPQTESAQRPHTPQTICPLQETSGIILFFTSRHTSALQLLFSMNDMRAG